MSQSVRHVWISPDFLRDQAENVGKLLANKWDNEDADVYVVLIGDRGKVRAFEDRLFMYGPGDEDVTEASE